MIPMFVYSLPALRRLLEAEHVGDIRLLHTRHGGFPGVIILFRKSPA
jgi:hypothetical protein